MKSIGSLSKFFFTLLALYTLLLVSGCSEEAAAGLGIGIIPLYGLGSLLLLGLVVFA